MTQRFRTLIAWTLAFAVVMTAPLGGRALVYCLASDGSLQLELSSLDGCAGCTETVPSVLSDAGSECCVDLALMTASVSGTKEHRAPLVVFAALPSQSIEPGVNVEFWSADDLQLLPTTPSDPYVLRSPILLI